MEIFERSLQNLRNYKFTTLSFIFALLLSYYINYPKENLIFHNDPNILIPITVSTPKWPDWQLGGNKAKWGNFVQDIMCSHLMNSMCYLIVDYENEDTYSRTIMVNNLLDAKLSIADLIKPKNEKFSLLNSANWKINHYRLYKPYLRAMAIAPFITSTIRMDTKNPTVLLIGVAGATLNNFYHEMPQKPIITGVELDATMVDVAEKWFELKKSNRHIILVEDGVRFFQERNKNDEKYDAIFIDACHTDHDDELHCPIYEFRKELAYHVYRSLAENGTLAINVLSLNNTVSAYDKIKNVYEKYFPTCFFLDAQNSDWMNRVLVCTKNLNINVNQNEFVLRLHKNMHNKFLKSNDFKVELIL